MGSCFSGKLLSLKLSVWDRVLVGRKWGKLSSKKLSWIVKFCRINFVTADLLRHILQAITFLGFVEQNHEMCHDGGTLLTTKTENVMVISNQTQAYL